MMRKKRNDQSKYTCYKGVGCYPNVDSPWYNNTKQNGDHTRRHVLDKCHFGLIVLTADNQCQSSNRETYYVL